MSARRSSAFDALGFRFSVSGADAALIESVDSLFRGLESPGKVRHRYQVRRSRRDRAALDLQLDGTVVLEGVSRQRVLDRLVHDVNLRAVRSCPMQVLHAGGVVRNGQAVVLPADMGSGKSTLVAGLMRAGFSYLSDEAVAIDRDTIAQPYAKPLTIDRGAWSLFPDLEPPSSWASSESDSEWNVAPERFRRSMVAPPSPVGAFVFPRYAEGARTTVEVVSRAAAVTELANNTFFFNDHARASLYRLAEITRGVPCYRLVNGDLDEAVSAVVGLLDAAPTPASVNGAGVPAS